MAVFEPASLGTRNAEDGENSSIDASDSLIRAEFKLARSFDEPEDRVAELIAALSSEDAERMWPVLIQLRPHLSD